MSELLELTSNGEMWRCMEGHIFLVATDEVPGCPTCAEIKAAKDKRGKEVLKMALAEVAEEDSLIGEHILESYREQFRS